MLTWRHRADLPGTKGVELATLLVLSGPKKRTSHSLLGGSGGIDAYAQFIDTVRSVAGARHGVVEGELEVATVLAARVAAPSDMRPAPIAPV